MKKRYRDISYLILVILFYYVIAHTTILSLDDFRWGTARGMDRLINNFDNYNGRYLGNYTIILMTRSYLAQVLIPTVVNTGIVVLIYKILQKEVNLSIILIFLLTIPSEIYSQTYGFMSGFANYNTAIFLILFIIYLLKKPETVRIDLIWLALAGISVQLFLENISAVNIILAVLFLIFSLFEKKYFKKAIVFLISNLIGTVIMFSNSAYTTDATSRGLSNIDFKAIPKIFLTEWSELFFKENIILLIILAVGVHFISSKNKYIKYILHLLLTYFVIRYHLNITWNNIPSTLIYMEGLFLISFILISLYLVYKSDILTKNTKLNFYFFFLLAGLYTGPFLAISMAGKPFIFPRNVLTTYILLCIAILYLYMPMIKLQSLRTINIKKAIKITTITIMVVIGSMSSVNSLFNNIRIESALEDIQAGKTEVKLERLPFENLYLTWNISETSSFMPQFKEYYNIPENIKIEQVSLRNRFTQ